MSGHERERLSAYLDDALAPAERAQVADHVGACAECAARLAELAAVDEAVAGLRSEAPRGYFESFPERVRARLEPRSRARRLPVWTWAAAAALLLLVVTPLTLLRRPNTRFSVPAQEVPAAAPPSLAKTQAPPEAYAPEEARAERKAEARPGRPVAALASPEPKQRQPAFASAPSEADARIAEEGAAPAAARKENVAALADAPAAAEAVASEAPSPLQASGERVLGERPGIAGRAATDETGLARGRVAAPAAEADWRRLDAARPRTPAEWRRLREDWRRFVTRDPRSPQADEARVRMIEAGREAWRAGSDPADQALFRKDATDYLDRGDAAQKERVESLLQRW